MKHKVHNYYFSTYLFDTRYLIIDGTIHKILNQKRQSSFKSNKTEKNASACLSEIH